MRILYSFLTHIVWFVLEFISLFNSKISLFVKGRKTTFSQLEASLKKDKDTIWVHVASLGEFEQGLPLIKKLKKQYPKNQILLTFFSPSGYEVKKNSGVADCITYLPFDTKKNAKRFVQLVQPKLAIFVKYEIWPNYLQALKKLKVPTILVSAIFKQRHIYFKRHGFFMRKILRAFSHFFVQDQHSKHLLESIEIDNCTISGDTRFDRVLEITESDHQLSFMDAFKKNNFCIVFGSTWPEDDAIIADFINGTDTIKFVIAPHNVKPAQIETLAAKINRTTICYTEVDNQKLAEYDVLILDTIGLLTKVYSYADVAYVGGGFATGLHNTLEPAVFGIPVVIGPEFDNFKEAQDLIEKKGVLSISSKAEFQQVMDKLQGDPKFLKKTGDINRAYIKNNAGATDKIISYLKSFLD